MTPLVTPISYPESAYHWVCILKQTLVQSRISFVVQAPSNLTPKPVLIVLSGPEPQNHGYYKLSCCRVCLVLQLTNADFG